MARWAPVRADVIGEYADEVATVFLGGAPTARILVAVDGFEPGSRASFAGDLAAAFRERGVAATVVPLDAFGGGDPDRFGGSLDVAAFRADVIDPFRRGEAVRVAGESDDSAAADRAVLIVDGQALLRPELVGLWHSTLWLDPHADAATPGEQAYRREVDPKRRAAANIDMTDPEHPRRTFADSC